MDKQVRNTTEIVRLAKQKSKKTREKVDKAISKSWLYKEHDIRQRIESLRERQITANVVSKPKKSSRSEEILIKTLKRRVMELEKENKKLQNQIQKLYGDLYNKE
ncbi:transposase [Staphylococcus aureus]|uniref:acyltransferase n=1 Tax=Staphylococcus aureus TaxID=1280 RepID=UPI001FB8BFDA|nr:acyltransferase [Staphylococcus aureus]UOH59977.1 transposase [Staphylococcus aureus]UOH61007.1 transposase [Staphylococcus aureus]